VTLPTRPGVTQSFYVTKPPSAPIASLVLFAGGDGKLRDYGPADLAHGNFLVRSRDLFVAEGFAVAVIDAPSDESSGMREFRSSKDHATDIAAVVAWLKAADPAPVWLIGTSRGTISAANGAAAVPGVAGLVLTSSVLRGSRSNPGNVYNVPLGKIAVPVLVTHNREDSCVVCPFSDTGSLMSALSASPRKELIAFAGGDTPRSDPCEALSRHGYIGLEREVVGAIAAWIKQQG
jgi:pimeloyl-ACP methyl ester carboxylesterase